MRKKMFGRRRRFAIAIAYSGGISNCAYQIGFTKALMQYIARDEIAMLSGASCGIFTAYALSADKLDYAENLYRNIDIARKTELFWQVFAKDLLADHMDAMLDGQDVLTVPVCFPVCYLPVFSTRYYWIQGAYNRVWKRYIAAATNYPFLHVFPSFMHGRFAIDGGAVDNIPLYPLLRAAQHTAAQQPLDLIFVLHFDSQYDHRRVCSAPVPVIDLDLSYCNGFSKAHYDFSRDEIEKRLHTSFAYGNDICARLFGGDGSRAHFQKTADEIFMQEHAARQKCFSVDRLVTALNVVGRKFRSDARCMQRLF